METTGSSFLRFFKLWQPPIPFTNFVCQSIALKNRRSEKTYKIQCICFPCILSLWHPELSTNIGVGCKIRSSWGPCDGLWVGKACGWEFMLCLCLSFTFWTFSFYHQLPCICHQSIFAVVPSQSCARRRSSMQRTAFDLETARKVHLHHFLPRHHNLFFSNSDLLPHTLNCFWQFPPSSTLLESNAFHFVAPCLSFRRVVKQCSDIWSHRLGER